MRAVTVQPTTETGLATEPKVYRMKYYIVEREKLRTMVMHAHPDPKTLMMKACCKQPACTMHKTHTVGVPDNCCPAAWLGAGCPS